MREMMYDRFPTASAMKVWVVGTGSLIDLMERIEKLLVPYATVAQRFWMLRTVDSSGWSVQLVSLRQRPQVNRFDGHILQPIRSAFRMAKKSHSLLTCVDLSAFNSSCRHTNVYCLIIASSINRTIFGFIEAKPRWDWEELQVISWGVVDNKY